MKKLLIGALLLFPTLAFAQTTFDTNLSYGSSGSDVNALQEFLVTQHLLAPKFVTGNFYSITLGAVKAFQAAESITPVSGFVGPITRETINTILADEIPTSEYNAATSTEPVDLSATTTIPSYTPPQVIYVPAPTQNQQSNSEPVGITQTTTPIIPQRNPPTLTVTNIITNDPSTIVAGTTSVTMASFGLEVSAGDENIRLSSISLYLTLGGGANATDLSHCEIWAYGAPLNAGSRDINPNGNSQMYVFSLDQGLQVNAGTNFIATVECNVYPTAVSGNTYSWTIDPNVSDWSASGIMWGDPISTSVVQGFGDTISVQ